MSVFSRAFMPMAILFAFGCGSDSPAEVEDMPPSVTIQQPPAGGTSVEGSEVTLSATADDPEDGSLTASIAWSSSLDGPLGTGGSLDVTLSVGVHSLSASVTDSDGQSATADVSHEITANLAPTLTIDAPADGNEFDGPVEFRGSASDPEDGDLAESIEWSSSIDGALGTGAVVSAELSVGAHTITATVSDGNGNAASADVAIEVLAPVVPSTYVVELVRDGSSALHLVELTPEGTEALIGVLRTPAGEVKVLTDIAESPDGSLFGVSRTALYSIDAETATLTQIGGPIGDPSVVGMAFDRDGNLFGSTDDGNLLTVDPTTGATSVVGAFGGGLIADGDIAFSETGQLWGSLLESGTSVIASIDPETGIATVLGPSGRPHIWALTTEGEMLYGFATDRADTNSLISIDTGSGAATEVRSIGIIAGGAGVSPRSGG